MILCGAVRAIMDWFYVKKEETYKLGGDRRLYSANISL